VDVGGLLLLIIPHLCPLLHSLATSVGRNKPKALFEYVVVTNNIFPLYLINGTEFLKKIYY
jgi:hypothetical protein